MNPNTTTRGLVVPLPTRPRSREPQTGVPYAMAVNAPELRRQMWLRGLTGAELARRAKVSQATISRALNGRRIHPAKLRAVSEVLHQVKPVIELVEVTLEDSGKAIDTTR